LINKVFDYIQKCTIFDWFFSTRHVLNFARRGEIACASEVADYNSVTLLPAVREAILR